MTLIQIGALALVALILALTVVRPTLSRPGPSARGALAAPGTFAGVAGVGNLELGQPGEDRRSGNLLADPGRAEAGEPALPPSGETLRLAVAERPEQAVSMLREWLDTADEEAA